MKMKTLRHLAAIVPVAVLLTACGSDGGDSVAQQSPGNSGGSGGSGNSGGSGGQVVRPVTGATDHALVPEHALRLVFKNSTQSVPDEDIYIQVFANRHVDSGGKLQYVKPGQRTPDGTIGEVALASKSWNNTLVGSGKEDICRIQVALPTQAGKETVNYCHPYAIRLSDLANGALYLPPEEYHGGRLYISYGKPVYMRVNETENGIIPPDLISGVDPNHKIIFDFYEFTWDRDGKGKTTFAGNTTQVDAFGIPMLVTLEARKLNPNDTSESLLQYVRGISVGAGSTSGKPDRTALFADFGMSMTGAADGFDVLVQKDDDRLLRIVNPDKHKSFRPDFGAASTNADYFDGYVNAVWNHFKAKPWNHFDRALSEAEAATLADKKRSADATQCNGQAIFYDTPPTNHFTGCIESVKKDGAMVEVLNVYYTRANESTIYGPMPMTKPRSVEIFGQAQPAERRPNFSTLMPGTSREAQEQRGIAEGGFNAAWRDLSTAINRGVALQQEEKWHDENAFYKNLDGDAVADKKGRHIYNHFAKYLHAVSKDRRAYALAFDDVGDKSSVAILPGDAIEQKNLRDPASLTFELFN